MFRKRDGNWYSIWTMDTSGNHLTEIVASKDWAAITPTWSADGTRLVFTTVHLSPISKKEKRVWKGDDIWLVGADGGNLLRLTSTTDPEWSPRCSIDGRIYFTSSRGGHNNIWSIEPIGMSLGMVNE